MKKILLNLGFLVAVGYLPAQTIVSTDAQMTNAVLEEFGGIYCVFCPDGHAIGNAISDANPDVVLINVQSGIYANPTGGDPDFRTEYGQAIDDQTGLVGYPAGTVNRHVFSGMEQGNAGTTAISRGSWANAVNLIMQQPAPVNVAATAALNVTSGEMTIYVEIYYTADSEVATNRLNIALLQSGIVGPQTGGNMGNNYVHKHVLRDMITGQWGEEISTTTAGHFEARTYTYSLPSAIREVLVDPSEIELAIFIAEGQQEILNGISVTPTVTSDYTVDANLLLGASAPIVCGSEISPTITIRNDGTETITSLTIEYQVNGAEVSTFDWTGSLEFLESEEVELPAVTYVGMIGETNLVDVAITSTNAVPDQGETNNAVSITFENAPVAATSTITLQLRTDNYGYETYWEFVDDEGGVLASGGNTLVRNNGGGQQTAAAGNPGAYGNNQTITETIELPASGCYSFRILDDYSDGICCDYGNGFYNIKDAEGNTILSGGSFTNDQVDPFRADLVSGLADLVKSGEVNVFPNPVTNREFSVVFDLLENVNMEVALFNAAGQQVASLGRKNYTSGLTRLNLTTDHLPNGVYFLSLVTNEDALTKKVVVFR